jgi:hypothetical protein
VAEGAEAQLAGPRDECSAGEGAGELLDAFALFGALLSLSVMRSLPSKAWGGEAVLFSRPDFDNS